MIENAAIHLTEISIVPIRPEEGLLGFASFVLNDQFFAGNIASYSRPNGDLRLCYPAKSLAGGSKINFFNPITKAAGSQILAAVAAKYHEITRGISHDQ